MWYETKILPIRPAPAYTSMFDPKYQADNKAWLQEFLFSVQDDLASRSVVFKRILESESGNSPEERDRQTTAPTSKTRNAMLTQKCYQTQEEWEADLLTNPFYRV